MCFETLDDLLHERNGILRTSDALARGITKSQFYEYVNSAKLEKAAHGIYVSADMLTDELYLLQAQFPRAVFSHEAALYLHDLSEYEPIPLTVTVPASYNSTGLTRKGVKVYYVKPEWYTLGLIEIPSFGGHLVHAYDLERTICDVIRRSEMMDVSAFNYAVREYTKRRDKNYAKLIRYAAALRVEKKLREKMLDEYGFKRTAWVLANTLHELKWDGRFSYANKHWAEKIYIPTDLIHNSDFVVRSHPAVLDGFVSFYRKAVQALNLFGAEHCVGDRAEQDYTGKVLVLSPDTLKESCWSQENQLWYAHDGFGCRPHAIGRSVRCTCLGDGETTRWNRHEFIGVLDEKYLPDWAREKLMELTAPRQEEPTAGEMKLE